MRNKLNQIALIVISCAMCLGAVSCRTAGQIETQETTVPIYKTQDTTQNSSEIQDATKISTTEMPTFTGNEDFFWNTRFNHNSYQNGDGITFELLSYPFKLGDSYEKLGVRIADIDSALWISSYGTYLNLEKKIDGEWVRLEVIRGPYANGSEDEKSRQRRDELLSQYSVFHMLECEIIPALSAGEYRFVAYFVTGMVQINANGAETGSPEEVRHYYIPFEVVE